MSNKEEKEEASYLDRKLEYYNDEEKEIVKQLLKEHDMLTSNGVTTKNWLDFSRPELKRITLDGTYTLNELKGIVEILERTGN